MHKAKILDIIVESINYVIISYALTNMAFLFSASLFSYCSLPRKYGWRVTIGAK